MTNPNTNQDNVQPGQPGQKGSNPDQAHTDTKQSAAADAKSDDQKSAPAQNDAAGTSRR